jgi:hypothetical protein
MRQLTGLLLSLAAPRPFVACKKKPIFGFFRK